jgi:DNA-binding NarL/FixJ family response regulator
MEPINVFLLDDHKIVRDGLKSILGLNPDIAVAGEESNPESFLKSLPKLSFDILILDLSLPFIPGMEVLKKVAQSRKDVKVLVLSMHDNAEYMTRAINEGAAGYLTKDCPSEILIKALKEIKSKGRFNSTLSNASTTLPLAEEDSEQKILTPKEKEVLSLMVKGMSSKEMAAQFGLSSRTVEAHRLNIMRKLGTANSAETIAIALRKNLIR